MEEEDADSPSVITESLDFAFSSYNGHPGYLRPAADWKPAVSQKIMEALRNDPRQVMDSFRIDWRIMPLLHWVCRFGLTLDLVQLIHALHPSACQTRLSIRGSPSGRLPIQEAIFSNKHCDLATICFLLEAYPESATKERMREIIPRCSPTEIKHILNRFLTEEDILETTKSGQLEWSYPASLPSDLLQWIAELHHKTSLTVVGKVENGPGFCWKVTNEGITLDVVIDESFGFCIEELLKVRGVSLEAIEIDNTDYSCSSVVNYLISTLNKYDSIENPPTGMDDSESQQRRAQGHGLSAPPPYQADLDLSSVKRLKLVSEIRGAEQMDQLLNGIDRGLPNLNILELDNIDWGPLPDVPSEGFIKLPRLADRLIELRVRLHPLAARNALTLMASSTCLKEFCMENATDDVFDEMTQLGNALQQNRSLEGLQLDCRFDDGDAFASHLARALQANTTLKRLELHTLNDSFALIELISSKRNTTLEEVVVNDLDETFELQYWCEMNQLTPLFQDVSLSDAIALLLPFLSARDDDDAGGLNSWRPSIAYGLVRCRPDLWRPE